MPNLPQKNFDFQLCPEVKAYAAQDRERRREFFC